jgi:NitT/TauT family transport system permease protein
MSELRAAVDEARTAPAAPSGALKPRRVSIWDRIPTPISIALFSAFLVFLWQVVVWLQLTSQLVLPPPLAVGAALVDVMANVLTGGHVARNLWLTAQASVIGFVIAAIAGIGLGVLTAETAFGRKVALPFLVGINAAPKVAFAPLFVAWFGFGISSKAALAGFIAFFPLLIDTAAGLASVDRQQLRLFRSLRGSFWQTFFKLKVPASAPFIFAGLKTASVLAVVGALVGEFLGGGSGMGEIIRVAANQLNVARLFAYVILLSVAGYLFYGLIAWIERKVVFWQEPHGIAHADQL